MLIWLETTRNGQNDPWVDDTMWNQGSLGSVTGKEQENFLLSSSIPIKVKLLFKYNFTPSRFTLPSPDTQAMCVMIMVCVCACVLCYDNGYNDLRRCWRYLRCSSDPRRRTDTVSKNGCLRPRQNSASTYRRAPPSGSRLQASNDQKHTLNIKMDSSGLKKNSSKFTRKSVHISNCLKKTTKKTGIHCH